MRAENTLAYYNMATITAVKSYIVRALIVSVVGLCVLLCHFNTIFPDNLYDSFMMIVRVEITASTKTH
jgi:hypothetical protein